MRRALVLFIAISLLVLMSMIATERFGPVFGQAPAAGRVVAVLLCGPGSSAEPTAILVQAADFSAGAPRVEAEAFCADSLAELFDAGLTLASVVEAPNGGALYTLTR
jgi:hypothetical protein